MKLATKVAIGGALTGASEGFLRGYGIGSDIQARRIAAKRTSRMEMMEDEQRELAKRQEQREITTIQESSTDRARLRAEKIAEISITADFEKAPAEQQTAVFDEISTALTPAIPEENRRALVTQQIMDTTLQGKKDAAAALAGELEARRAAARPKPEPREKEKDPVETFKKDLSVSEKAARKDIEDSMAVFETINFPDATEAEKSEARKKMAEAWKALERIRDIRSELEATPLDQQAAKIEEIRSRMGVQEPAPAGDTTPISADETALLEEGKAKIRQAVAGGMSIEDILAQLEEAAYPDTVKASLREMLAGLPGGGKRGAAQAGEIVPTAPEAVPRLGEGGQPPTTAQRYLRNLQKR